MTSKKYDFDNRICRTCKHWESDGSDYGTCLELREKVEAKLLDPMFGSASVFEYFETEGDFGCNLWKVKEDKLGP